MTGDSGFIDRFLAFAEQQPNAAAIREFEGKRQFTYGGARREIEVLRGQLTARNVGEGDTVLLMLPMGAEFIFSFYAIASLKAIAVIVSPHLTSWELAPIIRSAKPKGVISDRILISAHTQELGDLDPEAFILSVDGINGACPLTVINAEDDLVPLLPLQPLGHDNPAVSCHYTYKGLATPLGVLHRYHDYTHAIVGAADGLDLQPGEIFLDWLPIYAVYSLTLSVLMPLANGCEILLVEKVRSNFLQLLGDTQARLVPMIPPMFPLLLRQAENQPIPPLNPRLLLVSGGAYLDADMAKRVHRTLGVEIMQGYGTTETLPIIANKPGSNRPGSIGRSLIAANKVAILDPHGQELPPGEQFVGEIAVLGPTVSEGFFKNPQDSAHFFRSGWFHTGDIGWRDEDGYFHFVCRRIAITKVAAQMVDLIEVEQVLATHPSILQARALVRNDDELVASVMAHNAPEIDARALRDYCRQYLSPHKVPKHFNIYPSEGSER
ncbi:MAG: class I adenylate-forming enzyme family protein [Betaproteobacteria bacterium]